MKGYDYICKSYPHYPLIAKSLNENLSTYKTKKDIVFLEPNPGDSEIIGVEGYGRYLDCIPLIENNEFQSYAGQHGGNNITVDIAAHIIVAKAKNEPNLKNSVFSLIKTMYQLKGWGKGFLYQIYIMLCYCIPKKICEYICKIKKIA